MGLDIQSRSAEVWRSVRFRRGELLAGVTVIASLAALGAVLSLVWWWFAPNITVVTDSHGAMFTNEQPEQFIASDSRFGIIASLAGVAAGLIVWCLRRWRGSVLLISLALGGLAGSWLMREVGEEIGRMTGRDALAGAGLGEYIDVPVMNLHATGLLFVQSLLAVIVYVMCASWCSSPDLRSTTTAAENVTAPKETDSKAMNLKDTKTAMETML